MNIPIIFISRAVFRRIVLASALMAGAPALPAMDRLVPSGYSTIQLALDAAFSGDTIIISTGSYGRVRTSRTFSSEVMIRPAAGASVTTQGWYFDSGARNIKLTGVTIHEPDVSNQTLGSAIRVTGLTSDLTFDGLTITAGRHGARLESGSITTPSNIKILNCDISHVFVDGIQISGGLDILVNRNHIHDINIGQEGGKDLHNDGIQAFCGKNIIISQNWIHFNDPPADGPNQGIIVGRASGSTLQNVAVVNNLVHDWPGTEITVSGVDTVDVFNNTAWDSDTSCSFAISQPHGPNTNFRFANNIIRKLSFSSAIGPGGTPPHLTQPAGSGVYANNLIMTGGDTDAARFTITSDPQFANPDAFAPATADYSPMPDSPVIDSANSTYAPGDDQRAIPRSLPDIGAVEFLPAVCVTDSFTGGNGNLAGHIGENGAAWTQHPAEAGIALIASNQIKAQAAGSGFTYLASWAPSSNEYLVEVDLIYRAPQSGSHMGVTARWDASLKTGYTARWRDGNWELYQFLNGTPTLLGSFAQTLTVGQTYRIKLSCRGISAGGKRLFVDGFQRIQSLTDQIAAPGRAGIRGSATTFMIDNMNVTDL